jgi:hypothetical protein
MTLLFVCVTEMCGQNRRHVAVQHPLMSAPGWHRCRTCRRSDSLMFIGDIPGMSGDEMDYGPEGLRVPRPAPLTFPIRIDLSPPARPLALPAPPVAPPIAPKSTFRTPSLPRFPFERVFGTPAVDAVRVRLTDRAPLLTGASATVCAALALLHPRPTKMCDLINLLVTAQVWQNTQGQNRFALLKEVEEWLDFFFGRGPVPDPELWFNALDRLVNGPGAVSPAQARRMLTLWRNDDATLTSQTLYALLESLLEHLEPRVLHILTVLTQGRAATLGIRSLRTLVSSVWRPLVHAAPAPAVPLMLWHAVRVVANDPALTQQNVQHAVVDQVSDLIARMRNVGMTWIECCQFLELMPDIVVANNRLQRLREFIRDAALQRAGVWTWTRILTELANFIRAGRVGYVVVDNVQIGGVAEHQVTFAAPNGDTIRLIATSNRITYFAEAHTYACGDLRDIAINRSGLALITFWRYDRDRAWVSAQALQLLGNQTVRNLATSGWAQRNYDPYMSLDNVANFEVGLQIRGFVPLNAGRREWQVYLTHLAPSAPSSIPNALIRVLRRLLI